MGKGIADEALYSADKRLLMRILRSYRSSHARYCISRKVLLGALLELIIHQDAYRRPNGI